MTMCTTPGAAVTQSPQSKTAEALSTDICSVVVTGMGGIVGQGVYKCLQGTRYRVIGVDASEHAAGMYAVPRAYIVPRSKDPRYVDRLLEICALEKARYMFMGLDMELPIIARAAPRLRKAGVIPLVSSPSVIDLADDKLETIRFLQSQGLPAPRTSDLADGYFREFGFPLVLKPRKGGSRSVGVHIVRNEHEFQTALAQIDRTNTVAQEYIDGDEFTCSALTFDGRCHGVMVMRRTLRDGDTHKAFVIRDSVIENFVFKVAELLKPFGSCNFQLRMRNGTPFIFEINPRVSGGTCIRAKAGYNEPLMTLEYLDRGIAPSYEIRPLSIFRYWKEIVVESSRVEDLRRTGTTDNAFLDF
jgi:carbamoyl-phosphate synthase large subunit